MANSIIMPKTGMAMTEGILVEWKVKVGDRVSKGDVIAVIETDKSTMELESDWDGVVLALLRGSGETAPVTEVIAWIGEAGEAVPADALRTTGTGGTGGRVKATPAARRLAAGKGIDLGSLRPGGRSGEIRLEDVEASGPVKATPLAARTAADRGIDLSGVRGSGRDGKIFLSDLAGKAPAPSPPWEEDRDGEGPVKTGTGGDTEVPLTKIRQITGRRMQESRQTIPDVVQHIRADVTRMLEARKEINEKRGLRITINDFVLAVTVKALAANPRMNAVFAGDRLICKGSVNLGVAVAAERGLLVPVIRNAGALSLGEISAKAAELAALAREGRLSNDDMSGGTFTVSNLGMFGITAFTPIINPPETGILGVCAVEDVVKLEGETLGIRKMMGLSLSFDHRAVDGAEAALFLKSLKDLLESPVLMLI
jgi:pyruvate dehydrogenase E2 component (dihydrolipoamide acetyltransferase)